MKIHDVLMSEELAIHPPALDVLLARMAPFYSRLPGLAREDARPALPAELSIADFINQRKPYQISEGFAIIHANDVMARGLTNVDRLFGATDYNDLIADFEQAAADQQVRGIFFDVNSPGGSVLGLQEARDAVIAARQEKPVVAYIEMIGASAAYGLSVGANAVVASVSAIVGSIGTISTFANVAGLLAQLGVKIEHLTGGALKAAGTPFREMSRAERDFLQGRVDEFTASFRGWVTKHRGAVPESAMQGQWFTGAQALELGLVDQVGGKRDAMDALRALAGL